MLYERASVRAPVPEELQSLAGFTEIKDRSLATATTVTGGDSSSTPAGKQGGGGFRSKASKLLYDSISSRPVIILG